MNSTTFIIDQNPILNGKLWIYTNYHCNLSCPYCLAQSTPTVDPRSISIETIFKIIDQAPTAGFSHIYFTGGEPFLRPDIFQILDYSAKRLPTTVLTNAMLLQGKRLKKLIEIRQPNLYIQVSLDGASSAQHDPNRGSGSWEKTVQGILALIAAEFKVSISTTLTDANRDRIEEICAFHRSMGIPEDRHIIRALAKRGFSQDGIEVNQENLPAEITISQDGAFWHPMTTENDMLLSQDIFPLEALLKLVHQKQSQSAGIPTEPALCFT